MTTSITSIRDIAAVVRGRRQSLSLSQAEVARRARVSRQWLSEFESGKPAAELRLVLRLVDALGLTLTLAASDSPAGSPPGPRAVDLDALLDTYRER